MEKIPLSDEFSSSDEFDGKEEVIGVHTGLHASGIELQEGLNTSISRNYCANCKRNIHCFVKIDKETKEAIVHKTCRNADCKCKCKTHYSCRECGYLHPYGQKCHNIEIKSTIKPKSDAIFNKLMSDWRELEKSQQPNIQKKTS